MAIPPAGRLLISHITLRGPEVRQLYGVISERPGISYDDLRNFCVVPVMTEDEFGLQEATLREALDFLVTATLVDQQGGARRKAHFRTASALPNVAFPLLLLRHIATLADDRQRAIILLHRQLIMRDIIAVTLTELRDDAERGPYGTLFAWTSEKVGFWAHLAASLGLVRRLERETELLVVPQLDLVVAALSWAVDNVPGTASLHAYLHAIECNFFACFTQNGRVHRGLAQALIALHRLARIRLTHESDAAQSILLGAWRISDVCLLREESIQ